MTFYCIFSSDEVQMAEPGGPSPISPPGLPSRARRDPRNAGSEGGSGGNPGSGHGSSWVEVPVLGEQHILHGGGRWAGGFS